MYIYRTPLVSWITHKPNSWTFIAGESQLRPSNPVAEVLLQWSAAFCFFLAFPLLFGISDTKENLAGRVLVYKSLLGGELVLATTMLGQAWITKEQMGTVARGPLLICVMGLVPLAVWRTYCLTLGRRVFGGDSTGEKRVKGKEL